MAGLTIFVQSPLPEDYDSVVIPLRLQLVNNSQYLRTFSDSIPITTKYFNEGPEPVDVNFYVKTFDLHLNGSAGSPFPLLTNPRAARRAAGKLTSATPKRTIARRRRRIKQPAARPCRSTRRSPRTSRIRQQVRARVSTQ